MKILQLGSFTVLTVLVFTKAAFAVGVSASVVTTAEARSESTIIDIDQDAQSGSVIASAAAFAFEENARAQASATARAVAVLGDISLSGDAQSVGQLGLEAAVGGLGEGIGHARAKQEDNLRLNTFSVPVGDQVIVLAKLKTSGFVAGRATTAPEIFRPPLPSFPADAGQYFGEVNIGASAGVFFLRCE